PEGQVSAIPRHDTDAGAQSGGEDRGAPDASMGRALPHERMKPPVEEIAGAIAAAHLDGWLFYDFRLSDPIAYRILGLAEGGLATRRWFCFVPARPASDKQAVLPQTLTSAVEAHRLDAIAPAERRVYRSEREMVAMLGEMLKGCRRIAMDYSLGCA